MKVEIVGTGRHWVFSITLGGLNIVSQIYTTRRACVRGLWRWWFRTVDEVWDQGATVFIDRAIRESRGK